jgi:hypothetical protein
MNRTAPALTAAVVIVLALAGCTPGGGPSSTSSPSTSSTPTASETPSESPEPEATVVAPSLDAADLENIADSINSGNTAALEGYLTDPIVVIYAASECCGPLTPLDAITSLDYLTNATGPWTFPTPEGTIDTYRAGFYAQYFPAGAYVGTASGSDPFVISFTIVDDKITTIFVSAGASLLLP